MLHRSECARIIDHTLIKPETTSDDIVALVEEAVELGTYSVCVSPSLLPIIVPRGLHVVAVCGFPSGAHTSAVKAAEAAEAISNGAEEIDMVVNLALVKAGYWEKVRRDIHEVREVSHGAVLKVIIESAALTDEEICNTCKAAEDAGGDFVKTSTGFHPSGGASVHAVTLMRRTVKDRLGVKASGGIRDASTAQKMIDAGASRLGLSASRDILNGYRE